MAMPGMARMPLPPVPSDGTVRAGEDAMCQTRMSRVWVYGRCFAAAAGGVRHHRTLTRHPWVGSQLSTSVDHCQRPAAQVVSGLACTTVNICSRLSTT